MAALTGGETALSGAGARYAKMAVVALCLLSISWTGIEWNCMTLYATSVMEELGITRTVFMFALTIDAAISAVVSLFFFGLLEQRFGLRRLIIVGGAFDTLAFLLWGSANSVLTLYLGSLTYGIGTSVTGYTLITAAVNQWYKKRMGSLIGTVNTCGSVSGIVCSLAIAAIIVAVGWRVSFYLSFVVSAATLAACFFLYKGSPQDLGVPPMYAEEAEEEAGASDGVDAQGPSFAETLRMPRFVLMAAAYLLLALASYAVMASLPLFASDLGLGAQQGLVVSISLAASAVTMTPLGAVCDRFGSRWGLALCSALLVLAALLLRLHSLPLPGLLLASACVGASYNNCIVPIGVSVKEAFGEREFSRKLGVPAGCSIVGISLGPVVINFFYDALGSYDFVLLLFAVLAVVCALLFRVATKRCY